MEDESTVTTASQGISLPNGAHTVLNFLAGRFPAELSANRLMAGSAGDWLAAGVGSVDEF